MNFALSPVQTVAFERRDRETLSPQATELFNSRTIFEDEQERTWLLENMRSTTILIKVDDSLHAITGNYAVRFVVDRFTWFTFESFVY